MCRRPLLLFPSHHILLKQHQDELGSIQAGFCVLLTRPHRYLSIFLLSGVKGVLLSLLQSWNHLFFEGTLILLWRRVLRSQAWGTRCAHCSCGVHAPRPSRWTELGNICMYVPLHKKDRHIYMCVYGGGCPMQLPPARFLTPQARLPSRMDAFLIFLDLPYFSYL